MTSLKGAPKFRVLDAMVTFFSLIIAANVPVVGLKSRPILISSGFKPRTSSMVNSADSDSFVGISHPRCEMLKQLEHLKKPLQSTVSLETRQE